jgi:hypothetical protein
VSSPNSPNSPNLSISNRITRARVGVRCQTARTVRTVGTFYIVTLSSTQSEVPPEIRLRRFLKAALRSHGLRCTDCRVVEAPTPGPDADRSPARRTDGTAAIPAGPQRRAASERCER